MRGLRLSQIFFYTLPIAGGIMQNLLSSWLYEFRLLAVVMSIVLFGVFVLGTVLLWRKAEVRAVLRPSKTLISATDRKRYGRKGLIVFISLYSPSPKSQSARLGGPADWLKLAAAENYRALDFANSNYRHTIEAILTHAGQLQHCWLISTVGVEGKMGGSRAYVPALVKHLRKECGLAQVQFHYEGCEIAQTMDNEVIQKSKELVEDIYNTARKLGTPLHPRQMMTDITGGYIGLKLGAILACLDSDRDIQVIGTHYNTDGQPTGDLFPILVGFEPDVSRVSY